MDRNVDFVNYFEDFLGPQTLLASPVGSDQWDIADTSSAGTPTYTVGGINGEFTAAFDATSEVQNVCLFKGDVLNFDIDLVQSIQFRVRVGGTYNAASSLAFGLCSARNDTIDNLAAHASFRLIGSNSVFVESDDGTRDVDDIATGLSLSTTYRRFYIDFSKGKNDVQFRIDGQRVATATVFDMSAYSVGLQPYVQLQKTAATATDSVIVDFIEIESRRA
jgi:hypothetical protein